MSLKPIICSLTLALILIASEANAVMPPLKIPEGAGVNIHFLEGHESQLDKIADAGFKFVRTDTHWDRVETVKGQYDWQASDALTANVEKRNLHPYFILDYSNKLYEPEVQFKGHAMTAPPTHPESVAAFAAFAAAAVTHYKGHEIIWEIWNEPDGGGWRPSTPDVNAYATLLKATITAMRQADPNVTIVAPTTHFTWSFLQPLLTMPGILQGLDTVSIHTYTTPPEAGQANYLQLQQLIKKYSPNRPIPFIDGESGYSTVDKNGVTIPQQADYMARQEIFNLVMGVPITIWYDWEDDGDDKTNPEANYGLLDVHDQPKPSYSAAKTVHTQLAGYHFDKLLKMPDPKDYVVLLKDDAGNEKLAAWTAEKTPHEASFKLDNSTTTSCVDATGSKCTEGLKDGVLNILLTPAPIYMSLKAL